MASRGLFRKRWRYVGVFGEELMLCAGRVRVGPFGQTFWAVWERRRGRLHESTRLARPGGGGEVRFEGSRLWIEAGGVSAELELGESRQVEVRCPAGRDFTWTRKQADVPVTGTVLIDGRAEEIEARGVIDDSAGRHPRRTEWAWSAGVGLSADGRSLGWNLVAGINDPASGSERAVWIDGIPAEVGPVEFEGLEAVRFDDGSRLELHAEAERSRRDNLLVIRSTYRQPFGTFTGSLPGLELASGYGVMEEHRALW